MKTLKTFKKLESIKIKNLYAIKGGGEKDKSKDKHPTLLLSLGGANMFKKFSQT